MKKRVIPGVLIAGFWLLLLLKGSSQLFCFIIVLLVLIAADEYLRMIDEKKLSSIERWCLNVGIAAPVGCIFMNPDINILPAIIVASFLILTCYVLFRYKELEDSFGFFCRLVFGVFYIGVLGSYFVLVRYLPDGASWLIIGSAITAGSDSGAYFVGRAMGKHKLSPNISPNKTIEGAIGGVLAGLIAALVFAWLLLPMVNWIFLCLAAIFLALVGIVGDLTESIIKRGTGTKDSGKLLGGHGGILDRVDSLLFVVPVLYYLLKFQGI